MRAPRRLALGLTLCLLGCPADPLPQPPPGSGAPRMGVNLARATYYTPAWVFADAFRLSRWSERDDYPWALDDPQGLGPPPLSASGYPQGLGAEQAVETLCLRGVGGRYPAGTWTLAFTGDGAVELGLDAARGRHEHDGQGQARVDFGVEPSDAGIRVRIVRSNPSDPVRDLRLWMPGVEGQTFHPAFLESLAPFAVIRFMDWGATNGSPVVGWDDRRRPDARTQAMHGSGVAYEWMLELANATGAEPWLCVPHLADDDHVTRLARLVAERLAPGRRVWIEYSNEVWNGGFEQARDVREQARAAGEPWPTRYARRAREVFALFAGELGERPRVRVVATHLANAETTAAILGQLQPGEADALAVGLYVGGRLGREGWRQTRELEVEQVLAALRQDVERRRGQVRRARALAVEAGLRLVAYEGGQHLAGVSAAAKQDEALNALFDAANRHAGMGDVYEALYTMWEQEGGDLFCHYSHVYRPTQHGRWGLLEAQDDQPTRAPKYRVTASRARRWDAPGPAPVSPPR